MDTTTDDTHYVWCPRREQRRAALLCNSRGCRRRENCQGYQSFEETLAVRDRAALIESVFTTVQGGTG